MGLMESQADGTLRALKARSLVGRSPGCELQIDKPCISREHAVLSWAGGRWEIRDLGSRNGTVVDGTPIEPGESLRLSQGALISFGEPEEAWRLSDAAAPEPFADADGAQVHGSGGMLMLPSAEQPDVTVYADGGGGWLAETDEGTVPIGDRDSLEVGGIRYELSLPTLLEATVDVVEPTVTTLTLDFAHSRDEEYVESSFEFLGRSTELKARSFTYTMLTLARLRLDDVGSGLPESEQGWVHQEDLARMIGSDPATLNVYISRARRQLADAGVKDASRIIERRRGTGQVRIGTHRLRVKPL